MLQLKWVHALVEYGSVERLSGALQAALRAIEDAKGRIPAELQPKLALLERETKQRSAASQGAGPSVGSASKTPE